MAGIHLHHHDLLHEGPDAIRPRLARIDDVTQLFVQVNDIFERNPSPIGTLERNPVADVILGEGLVYADVDVAGLSPELHQQSRTDAADDPLAIVRASTLGDDYEIVPWLNITNGAWTGDIAGNGVVDYRGRPVDRWLCPNGPLVAPMWGRVIVALVERYGYRRFLIDRIRYPDWGGEQVRPANLFSCFCDRCLTLMAEQGIDGEALRAELTMIAGLMKAGEFEAARERFVAEPLVRGWLRFRQRSVAAMVDAIGRLVREREPDVELWLDLWPPAYSWILGQDYGMLTALSPRLKHFPYHRLGGGADVQSLIDHFGHDDEARERAFAAFTRLFGLDYGQTYAEFRADGFPIRLVEDQNRRARDESRPGTYVYSGVQMWNLPPDELHRAAVATYASAADDVIYYCYGWAATDLFGASNGARATARPTGSAGSTGTSGAG